MMEEQRWHERGFELINLLSFRTGDFTLVSGKKSKFYLDMKRSMLHPECSGVIMNQILPILRKHHIDAVGGLELGAVPLVSQAVLYSWARHQPLEGFIVRKVPKDHGTALPIEGLMPSEIFGKNVAILEDVTTTGQSAMKAVKAVHACTTANVKVVVSVVDRHDGGRELFEDAGIAFESLYNIDEFLEHHGVVV